jgi:hypothetical protein
VDRDSASTRGQLASDGDGNDRAHRSNPHTKPIPHQFADDHSDTYTNPNGLRTDRYAYSYDNINTHSDFGPK